MEGLGLVGEEKPVGGGVEEKDIGGIEGGTVFGVEYLLSEKGESAAGVS
jgi:hypothetical protein